MPVMPVYCCRAGCAIHGVMLFADHDCPVHVFQNSSKEGVAPFVTVVAMPLPASAFVAQPPKYSLPRKARPALAVRKVSTKVLPGGMAGDTLVPGAAATFDGTSGKLPGDRKSRKSIPVMLVVVGIRAAMPLEVRLLAKLVCNAFAMVTVAVKPAAT